MKRIIVNLFLLLSVPFIQSCGDTACTNVVKNDAMFIMDVSDESLFNQISADLENNMASLVQKKNWSNLGACQTLRFSTIPINANDILDIRTSPIVGVLDKGIALNEQKRQSSLKPLSDLLFQSIDSYKVMTSDSLLTSGTNIINVFLKALNKVDPSSKTTVFLFSDLIENNTYFNFYKKIPAEGLASETMEQLIDSQVRTAFNQLVSTNSFANTEIIVVQKGVGGSSDTARKRALKAYWSEVFENLQLKNVRFVDNLTNVSM